MSVLNLSAEFSVRDGNRTFEHAKNFSSRHRLMSRRFFISGTPPNDPDSELIVIQQSLSFSNIQTAEEAIARTEKGLVGERLHLNRVRVSVPASQSLQIRDQGRDLKYYWGLAVFSIPSKQSDKLIGFCQAVGLVLLYEPRHPLAYFDQYVWRLSADLGQQTFQAQASWTSYLAEINALGANEMTSQEVMCVIRDDDPGHEDTTILGKMQTLL